MGNKGESELKDKWDSLYKKPVSNEEYQQIASNLDGFFHTLKEWSDKEIPLNEVNVKEVKNEQPDNHRD